MANSIYIWIIPEFPQDKMIINSVTVEEEDTEPKEVSLEIHNPPKVIIDNVEYNHQEGDFDKGLGYTAVLSNGDMNLYFANGGKTVSYKRGKTQKHTETE